MAANRIIHFVSMTALASGLLGIAIPACADGGGADRAAMQEGAGIKPPASAELPPSDNKLTKVVRVTPLPPRRPADLETAFAAAQPTEQDMAEGAAPAPVAAVAPETGVPQPAAIAEPSPAPAPAPVAVSEPAASRAATGNADLALAGLAVAAPPQSAAFTPLPAQPRGSRMGMTALSAWPPVVENRQFTSAIRNSSSALPAGEPVETAAEVDKAAPEQPPGRPVPASEAPSPPAAIGMAMATITVQPQAAVSMAATAETPKADGSAQAAAPFFAAVPLPPVRPRLLAPVVSARAIQPTDDERSQDESVQKIGYVPPVRGKSRLNHIIGDNPDAANSLRSLISKHAAANGIPYRLADAVVRVESRYNIQARNGPYMGLMQIHPRTAASLGYGGDVRGLLEADTNLQYGIKYLAMAYRLAGGDTCGTIMRYQGGHRSVTMTAANRTYCNKVKMILAENHN